MSSTWKSNNDIWGYVRKVYSSILLINDVGKHLDLIMYLWIGLKERSYILKCI